MVLGKLVKDETHFFTENHLKRQELSDKSSSLMCPFYQMLRIIMTF